MPLEVFAPTGVLKRYVTAFWDYEDLVGDRAASLSILPDTAVYLCFLYADLLQTTHRGRQYTTRSGVAGFQTFRNDLGGSGTISGVSARLSPWGLNVFRGGIARDCAEARIDCRDIFPRYEIEALEDRLALARTSAERVREVEAFLLRSLDKSDEDRLVSEACRHLDMANGMASIRALARRLDTTERTLERRFLAHVGTTPKKYARVVRLRRALLWRKKGTSWADAAYATGYYDQSHMIRDFHELYGVSPERLHTGISASKTIAFSGLLDLHAGVAPGSIESARYSQAGAG